MLVGLTRVTGTAEKQAVGSLGLKQSELVESYALSTSSNNARASALSEAQCADAHLGAIEHPDIISDGTNNDCDLLGSVVLKLAGNVTDGHRGAVHTRHKHALANNFVEFGFRAAGHKLVKLGKQGQVDVVRLGSNTVLVANIAPTGDKINAL